ncbi:MAG: hypothetical protein PS018_15080 [bacterium]|nr:hypothetical protein [bacterium]
MTATPQSIATARRNLVQRIERYLAELEKRDAAISQREGDHLVRALGHLEGGTFADGERDMMWAEWASRQPGDAEPHPTATRAALLKQLAAALAEGQ